MRLISIFLIGVSALSVSAVHPRQKRHIELPENDKPAKKKKRTAKNELIHLVGKYYTEKNTLSRHHILQDILSLLEDESLDIPNFYFFEEPEVTSFVSVIKDALVYKIATQPDINSLRLVQDNYAKLAQLIRQQPRDFLLGELAQLMIIVDFARLYFKYELLLNNGSSPRSSKEKQKLVNLKKHFALNYHNKNLQKQLCDALSIEEEFFTTLVPERATETSTSVRARARISPKRNKSPRNRITENARPLSITSETVTQSALHQSPVSLAQDAPTMLADEAITMAPESVVLSRHDDQQPETPEVVEQSPKKQVRFLADLVQGRTERKEVTSLVSRLKTPAAIAQVQETFDETVNKAVEDSIIRMAGAARTAIRVYSHHVAPKISRAHDKDLLAAQRKTEIFASKILQELVEVIQSSNEDRIFKNRMNLVVALNLSIDALGVFRDGTGKVEEFRRSSSLDENNLATAIIAIQKINQGLTRSLSKNNIAQLATRGGAVKTSGVSLGAHIEYVILTRMTELNALVAHNPKWMIKFVDSFERHLGTIIADSASSAE